MGLKSKEAIINLHLLLTVTSVKDISPPPKSLYRVNKNLPIHLKYKYQIFCTTAFKFNNETLEYEDKCEKIFILNLDFQNQNRNL